MIVTVSEYGREEKDVFQGSEEKVMAELLTAYPWLFLPKDGNVHNVINILNHTMFFSVDIKDDEGDKFDGEEDFFLDSIAHQPNGGEYKAPA